MDTTTTTSTLTHDRDVTIRAIRSNLKRRGLTWISVTGGRGTSYGWIRITATPSTGATRYGDMTEEQQRQLCAALGIENAGYRQGVSVPASNDYRAEYLARSAGRTPDVIGQPYW